MNAWIASALLAGLCAFTNAAAQDKLQEKGANFSDAVITLVTSALDNDPELRAMQIDVQTQDGVVRLSGFVDSMAQVDRAGELARRVDGVSGVRNSIRVTARPSRA